MTSRWKRALARKPLEQVLADADASGLRRKLGAGSLLVLGVANILGAGIYVMTGEAAASFAGPAVLLSFVLAGLACGFTGLCYAELSSVIPASRLACAKRARSRSGVGSVSAPVSRWSPRIAKPPFWISASVPLLELKTLTLPLITRTSVRDPSGATSTAN